ncbi:hypothetical protein GGR50DRAFT_646759 [Xylaria sp. CBS 124048]|nr:hypothetical protein GGR50DRAFT_646759 [Xylaria sp. CBS 124048]
MEGPSRMSSHYPLNGLDLDFRRYAHRPIEGRDIFIGRLMSDLIDSRRLLPKTYTTVINGPRNFGLVRSQDRELALDLQVMWRLIDPDWPKGPNVTLQEIIIRLVQEHYLGHDHLIRQVNKSLSYIDHHREHAAGWKRPMISHLAFIQKAFSVSHRYSVFSGSSQLPYDEGPWNARLSLGACFLAAPWVIHGPNWPASMEQEAKRSGYLTMPHNNALCHRPPLRSQSQPAADSWVVGAPLTYEPEGFISYVPFFPRKSLVELDKRARRRSLSRSHIKAMFTDNKPEWFIEDFDRPRKRRWVPPKHPCSNCAQYTHATKNCPSTCGYCNSADHKARNCTMKPENRCKCRPFPQFHRASQCHVRCSRRCGSPYPPGNFKHMSAMLCTNRCCMCGVKGHCGKKCSLKKCPCGQQHLTQDCRWKVECPVKGCQFYLCHLHCRECGRKREQGSENAFVGRTCQTCLKNGISASGRTA